MKKTLPLFLLIIVFTINACAPLTAATSVVVIPSQNPTAESSTDPVTADPISSTQVSPWNIYNDQKYGYSIGYPDFYNVTIVNDEYVEIGDKIVVTVSNTDPSTLLGDGPAIDSVTDVQVGVYPAKLLTGYIGAVGGYIPQQIRRFVFERNGYYFVVTLYALGLHVTEGEFSQIAQLNPEDVSLFDNIVASLQFP